MSTINKVIIQGIEYGIKDIDATDIDKKLRNAIQRVEGRATDSNPTRDPFVEMELPSYELSYMLSALDNLATSGRDFGNYYCWLGEERVMIVHNKIASVSAAYIQMIIGTGFAIDGGNLTHSVSNHTAGIYYRTYITGSFSAWKVGNQDYITAQISALLDGTDPDKVDSLKDLIAWVEEHGAEASEMASAIEKNTTDIANEVARAKAEEAELLKRLQGISADSNPETDPFKYIHLGQTADNMATLKNKIDELANKESVGFYRIVANNQSIVELHVIQMTSTLRGVMQVLKGPLTIYESGNFAIATNDYIIAHRYCLPDSISAWRISNKTAIVEYTKGTAPDSPSTYSTPMFLGNFTDYAEFLAKLDDMHYNEKTTFKEGKGNCVGWFRAKAGTDYIDIKCVCRYVFGDNWQQVISGFFKLNSAGTLKASTTEYTTLFRNREGSYNSSTGVAVEGTWSAWKKITTVQ